MKRFLTTGFFCAILGIVIGGAPADASLISRGFLDEVLTSYATNTALDLKANKADLTTLSNKIGTLPSGSLLGNSPAMDVLFMYTQNTDTPVFPNSLSDLINQLYGSNGMGAITALLHGFDFDYFGEDVPVVGILPAMELGLSATQAAETAQETANAAKSTADANTTKIGDLPSGKFPSMPGHVFLFALNQPLTYPTSLAELINAIYGNSETGARGLLDAIVMGIGRDPDGDGQKEPGAGLVPNFDLAKNANNLASANATKIGTLPTEYATVGAALTAIKLDIDAKSLPSTSADGQYVLSAKKVGETISYTWVKMDLTDEEQSQ